MIDIQQVRQWYDIFHGDKFTLNGVPDLVEVRLWGDNKNKVFSGYFRDVETLLAALQPFSEGYAIYSPINALHPGCNSRKQGMNQIIPYGATASDTDITGRRWLFIDFDPTRPADTNSTDEEKALAWKMMLRVKTYLRDKGFKSPVVADSANGYHLYYAVHLPKNNETDKLCQDFLRTIDAFFANDAVEVDLKVFNPARISKIIGTYSNKGSNTQERPQRCSWFVEVPDVIEETDIAFVKNVVAEYPHTERPSRENGYNVERFDLRAFIHQHGIEVVKESAFKSGTKFVLKECPFDSNHKAPDAALFLTLDGAVGFKCFHNSCSNKTWKDFRLHYDPQAYTHSYSPRREYDRKPEPPQIVAETQEIGKKWLSMGEIKWRNPADIVHIKTGITKIDEKVGGLALGDLTIISGLNASGKTSLLDHFLLSATMQGYKSLVWSGEMQDWRFMNWLDLMAAGPNFVMKKRGYDNLYYVSPDTAGRINAWIGDSVRLYNNNYGSKYSQLLADVKEEVDKTGAKLLLFDNLMAMQIDNIVGDKNEKQSTLIQEIKDYAKAKDVAIVMVCHPRKEQFFLRKDSIAGTADLTNTADNVFIIHRVGKDFFRRGEEFFGKGKLDEFEQCGNVIEVAKHRETGLVDFLVGLYYDIPSKRFKNDIGEHIVYGWQPDDLPEDDLPLATTEIQPSREFDNNPVGQEINRQIENPKPYAEPSSFGFAMPPEDDLPF